MTRLDRQVLRLAIPNLLASVSVPLVGIADTAMIGRLPEVAYLGAVATASVLFDVLYWGVGFLRMGTTSLVAQYFGAGDCRACAQTLYRSLLLSLLLGMAMVVLQVGIARLGFALAGGSPQVQEWGQRYFAVRIWAAPLVLCTFALNGFFLGTANALGPLYLTLATNLVNIGADYALIFGHWGAPALGVVGAAWAGVLASGAGVLVGGLVLVWQYRPYLRERIEGVFDQRQLGHLFRTNAQLLGRTLCLLFAQFALLGMVSRQGEVPLAANAIVWQVWALVSYGVDGFAFAAEALVGNALGGRDFAGARRLARRILGWGGGIGLGFGVIYACGLEPIGRAFTPHQEVVVAIASLTWLIALVQPLNALVFVLDGIFIGANDVGYLFRAMAVSAFAFFVPAALLFVYSLGGELQGAWLAYDALMVGRFLTLWRRFRSEAWLKTFVA
ncbi:MAG: MATE family efflux transporter [Candidatus Latescibacteria bacterium]|nr:MATE family efflux transporter [Candidatus Latescibacterota bacterium]